jgi:hypothetical protein
VFFKKHQISVKTLLITKAPFGYMGINPSRTVSSHRTEPKMRYHLVDSTTLLQNENKAVLKFRKKNPNYSTLTGSCPNNLLT